MSEVTTEPSKPLISIIMATYNRADIIGYSIKSVLYQSYQNWELIVIGDCCTDDTEAVVMSFNSDKIKFHNLSENFGEQSYPNSYGMKLAQGEYIAYLNHDDIWLPDHLDSLYNTIINEECDMTYSLIGLYGNFNEYTVICCSPKGVYEPHILVPASVWLMKSTIPKEIGYWKSAREMITFPSEEYIYRIWKAGYKICPTVNMTMIKPVSTSVKNSYLIKSDFNEKIYLDISTNSNFREKYLMNLVNGSMSDFSVKVHLFKLFREITRSVVTMLSRFFDIHPMIIMNIIAYRGGKGKGINTLRKIRGLNKLSKD